ncbi:hypothetical protein IW249_002304 [Micromonospora vinacea]|uniref:Uncharacterized protein n=1 Tax=Micromonospora vinacea TaxID=709878 RepID=A0ABS0K045_9ACTN|nr:hypothetical protein [Micromonospora vinacea]
MRDGGTCALHRTGDETRTGPGPEAVPGRPYANLPYLISFQGPFLSPGSWPRVHHFASYT